MRLFQYSPNEPNFGLVVGLSGAALLVILVLAVLFVHFDGKHLIFSRHWKHPTSRLVMPLRQDYLAGDVSSA